MDYLYPRICQVSYNGNDDENYDNYEVYKYYNDLDYLNGISNSDYMDLSDDLENDENKLEWRYSTKSKNQRDVDSKRPKLKKSYTSIDNFHHNSINDLITPHKLLAESQKFINSQIKKNFLQTQFQQTHHYTADSLKSLQFFGGSNERKPYPTSNSGELVRTSHDFVKNRVFPQSALLPKRKSDYYLEYINIINNPALNPKYYTDIRYTAIEKKKCERCFGPHSSENHPKKNIFIPPEKIRPFEFLNKKEPKTPKKEKERTTLLPPAPKLRPKKPATAPAESKPILEPVLSKIDSEPDIFYTNVDVLENREQLKSVSRSPDYYTEIVKMPKNDGSDDEYHDLKTFDEKSLDSLKTDDSKIKVVPQRPSFTPSNTLSAISIETKSSDEYIPPARPVAAVVERKRLVSFGNIISKASTPDSSSLHEMEIKHEKLMVFAKEQIVEPLETQVAKREKTPNFIEEEINEEVEDLVEIEEELVEIEDIEEVQVEKSKTPEPLRSPTPDEEPYEIHITELPELVKKAEPLNIIPTAKSVIRTTPKIDKKSPKEPTPPPKRPHIDVNSLRPKFTKHIVFDKEEPEEEEEVTLDGNGFDYDDWLAKWIIFKEGQLRRFESIFTEFDFMDKGFMNGESLIYALERCFTLNNLKMTYLMRVMSLLETDPFKYGANKKMFCVIAALGQRIQHLDDDWFHNLLPRLDVESVENKVFKVKKLWNFLVDIDTKRVKLKDLMIEMRAGNVTNEHIQYAEEKFSEKPSFDLLDYLTYIPLFIHIHEKIVLDPFNKKDII